MAHELLLSPDAETRFEAALAWLAAWPAHTEVLVLTASSDAGDDLARTLVARRGTRFGIQRTTLPRLAARLAANRLAREGKAPATRLALTATVARVVHRLTAASVLAWYGPVAACPGFAPALLATLEELRQEDVPPEACRPLPQCGPDLEQLSRHLEAELSRSQQADRAIVYRMALSDMPPEKRPVLLFDLSLETQAEARLVTALLQHAPAALATLPPGDDHTRDALLPHLTPRPAPPPGAPTSLATLKQHLFETTQPPVSTLDGTVTLTSWPGEARECLEVVRGIQAAAARGVPFDRMAVFLHNPTAYTAHLEEAFTRAEIPAWFTQGTRRPHPSGRAFMALLHCAAEGLSATRFAEYLSLSQVPRQDSPPPPWTAPENDLVSTGSVTVDTPDDPAYVELLKASSSDGEPSVPAPWRWEQLIVDAAVIGGLDRWERRMDGLDAELALQWKRVVHSHPEKAAALQRIRQDLRDLKAFAMPLLSQLEALPRNDTWETWLAALRPLAQKALKDPEAVLRKLDELSPMGSVGPVSLDEVLLVLGDELRAVSVKPTGRRYGAVYVASTEGSRGLVFDVVFVPGLAEKIFPSKIVEDPILLDSQRRALDSRLKLQSHRVARERLALRLAIGAARQSVHLSYPRLDVEQARPRVPSFYGLEVMRAAEGALPGYEGLNARAAVASAGRLGWPAPEHAADAVDPAEYDLAVLAPLVHVDPETTIGTASYLMTANQHLAEALRARYGRAQEGWSRYDGLIRLDAVARAALASHQLSARAYSPTALELFSHCPYRFFLNAIMRLSPREVPAAVEQMDPLTRGSLVHEVQFEVLTRLRDEGRLPLQAGDLDSALALADAVLRERAALYAEKLAPAIPRVWDDAIHLIQSDVREWLRRQVGVPWVPERFELSFGLSDRARVQEDPASVSDAVSLPIGLTVRGSIDLVERHATSGFHRATDYKTGRIKGQDGLHVQGGEILQPLIYAMVCETLLGGTVTGGRLYYCTTDGGFSERQVPLDDDTRNDMAAVTDIIHDALRRGELPPSPHKQACQWCDYRPVCGNDEVKRIETKRPELEGIKRLRSMR